MPDVYTYNDLPQPLRVQIVHIWMDTLGNREGLWCMKTVGAVLPLVWCVLDFLGYRIGLGLSQMQ